MDISFLKKIKLKRSEDYYIKILLKEVKLKDIMSEKVIAISEDAPFRDVPKKFNTHRIRHLPVVNKKGELVGLITQSDIFKIISPKQMMDGQYFYDEESLNDIILARVMRREVFCLHPNDNMGEALVNMAQNKYGCIPIVDDHNILCGIITQFDFLSFAAQIYLE